MVETNHTTDVEDNTSHVLDQKLRRIEEGIVLIVKLLTEQSKPVEGLAVAGQLNLIEKLIGLPAAVKILDRLASNDLIVDAICKKVEKRLLG